MNAKSFLIYCAALLAIGVARTQAIELIGDGGELFITGTATAAQNDNIFLNHSNTTSALVLDVVPGLSYEFGKNNALTKGSFAAYEDFQMFSKQSGHLNNDMGNIVSSLKYDDAKTKLNFDASWHQMDQAQVGLQNLAFLVNRNVYHAGGTGELSITDKSSFGTGIVFDDTDYRAVGFMDYRYIELPVNYYFKVEPKLDLSAGFRYRINTVGVGGIDSRDFFYNVGARGEFSPNLTGEVQVGYIEHKLDNGVTKNGIGLDSNLTFAYSPKTSLTLTAKNDYSYVATGSSIRDLGFALSGNSSLTDQWLLDARFGYDENSYIATTQKDNVYNFRVGATYIVSTAVRVSAAYTYMQDNSNVVAASFKNNTFSLSATLHY